MKNLFFVINLLDNNLAIAIVHLFEKEAPKKGFSLFWGVLG